MLWFVAYLGAGLSVASFPRTWFWPILDGARTAREQQQYLQMHVIGTGQCTISTFVSLSEQSQAEKCSKADDPASHINSCQEICLEKAENGFCLL
jgi:hypothetical protein